MQVVEQSAARERFAYLDGLRAAAALFVLVHHAFCMAYPVGLGVWPQGSLGYAIGWMVYGHFGVTVFIALAGYSLGLGVATLGGRLPAGFFGYMKSRAWRILPPYWAALVLTVILATTLIGEASGTHWDQSLPVNPNRWVVDALLLQDVFPGPSTAYTFWSIAVEWHIYLLLPLILLFRRRTTWAIAVFAAVALAAAVLIVSLVSPTIGRFGIQSLWATYYIVFALAVGACVAVRTHSPWIRRLPLKSIGLSLVACVVFLCLTNSYEWVYANYYWIDLLVGVATICLISAMMLGTSPRTARAFSWRPLAVVGTFSYSLYLIHAQVLQLFWQTFVRPFSLDRSDTLVVLWLAGVPASIAVSYGFYLLVEKRVPAWRIALRTKKRATSLPSKLTPPARRRQALVRQQERGTQIPPHDVNKRL